MRFIVRVFGANWMQIEEYLRCDIWEAGVAETRELIETGWTA